jgi:uncharacterized membrane protein YjgN (DUF898 family)
MDFIVITCPQCGFARSTDPSAIPPGTVTVTCPRCRERFSMARAEIRPAQSAPIQEPSGPAAPDPSPASLPPLDAASPPVAGLREKTPRTLSFIFTGTATEYFGIWIVNILLKIVTAGIYSAWAKVRRRRYFFGNTLLDDAPFHYLADPIALFKGWLIGAGLFILYMVGTKASPSLSFLFVIIFFSVTPWLIVRSRMFNNRNTEHRGVRFSFRPNYQEAYVVFAALPLAMPFTLGLLLPYMVYCQKKFFAENSSYGQTPFTFSATAEDFYKLFIKGLGVFILILGLFFVGVFFISMLLMGGTSLISLSAQKGDLAALQKSAGLAFGLLMLLIIPLYLTFAVYIETALANLNWNSTRIGSSRFTSSLGFAAILWIRLSNAFVIFASLGLMIPWATIRMTRYRFAHLTLETADGLEGFIAARQEDIGPAGEEIGDIFGIDVAL